MRRNPNITELLSPARHCHGVGQHPNPATFFGCGTNRIYCLPRRTLTGNRFIQDKAPFVTLENCTSKLGLLSICPIYPSFMNMQYGLQRCRYLGCTGILLRSTWLWSRRGGRNGPISPHRTLACSYMKRQASLDLHQLFHANVTHVPHQG